MDQQKTMIRMIQDLHRSIQGGQKMSTTSSHTAYFPLGDKLALEALEGDLASQRDLRQELVSCFWFSLFPIHSAAPQNQHWALNLFCFFFSFLFFMFSIGYHAETHLAKIIVNSKLLLTKTMWLIWKTAVRTPFLGDNTQPTQPQSMHLSPVISYFGNAYSWNFAGRRL